MSADTKKLTFALGIDFLGEISLRGKHLNPAVSNQDLAGRTDSHGTD